MGYQERFRSTWGRGIFEKSVVGYGKEKTG